MKLLEGLKEGLDRHVDEMKADDEALTEQEESLHSVVPGLVEKHIALETEAHDLQQMIDEMKNCDQNELLQAREKLSSIEAVIAAKKKLLESMQEDLQGKVETIEAGSELKAEFLEQIHEAERVKEECRGWSVSEVNALKGELNIKLHLYTRFKSLVLRIGVASVQMLENQSGWSIISAVSSPRTSAGPSLTMSYNNELRVSFHPMSLGTQPGQSNDASMNTSIEITYSPKAAQRSASSRLTLTKSLILCYLQKNLQTLQQSSLTPRQLLSFLSEAWKLAIRLEEEIRVLEFYGVIKPKLAEHATGASLRTRCTLLGNVRGRETNHIARLPNIQNGRVDIDIVVTPYACVRTGTDKHVGDHLGLGKLALDTDVMVHKVYGFGDGGVVGVSESEMRTSLLEGLQANSSELGSGVWGTAARDLASIVF
jgi:kinetochore protein Spc7/SPC105